MEDNGRPDTPRIDQRLKTLNEGETRYDKMEQFPTKEFPIIERPLFNPEQMLPRGNDPFVFLQKAKEAEEAKQRNQTNPMFMSSSLRKTSDPFKFLKDVRTGAQLARDADEPRALLRALLRDKLIDKTLLRPKESGQPTRFGDLKITNSGGRRRSKKSDTKKYKTRSKSRSRISTKRKNKNRRQTRK